MSREIEDQISAFADDELSAEECEFLVRRLERDPVKREKMLRYAVIGASIRGDLLDPDPDILRNRLRQTLDGVSLVPAPVSEMPGVGARLLRPALGTGIAAAAAVLGLLAIYRPAEVNVEEAVPAMAAQQEPVDVAAPSYVVPQDATVNLAVSDASIQPPARLTNYLVRHGEYAIGIGRTSIHSNVVSGRDASLDDPSEPTGD
jgi:negative regulator of sigma E activity